MICIIFMLNSLFDLSKQISRSCEIIVINETNVELKKQQKMEGASWVPFGVSNKMESISETLSTVFCFISMRSKLPLT